MMPKPTIGQTDWGDDINDYLDEQEVKVARVDPGTTMVNVSSYASLQEAYDDLPSGGGIVYIPAGRHDVGSGVALNRTKPATFRGIGRWARGNPLIDGLAETYPGNDPVIYSSTDAEHLFETLLPASVTNGYGFAWEGLTFEFSGAAAVSAIHAPCLNSALVQDCRFYATDDAPLDVVMIHTYVDAALGDDASWWRVLNNTISGGGLGIFGDPGGGNNNQNVFACNTALGEFDGGFAPITTAPFLTLYNAHRCSTISNNIEAYLTGIMVRSSSGCSFIGDGGERVAVFMDLDAVTGSHIAPVGTSVTSEPANSKLIKMDADTWGNVLILPNRYLYGANAIQLVDGYGLDRSTVLGGTEPQLGGNSYAIGNGAIDSIFKVQNSGAGALASGNGVIEIIGTNGSDAGSLLLLDNQGGGGNPGIRIQGGDIEMTEVTDRSAPAANTGRIYMRDNGSGKTQFVARFPSGAVQVIATEP